MSGQSSKLEDMTYDSTTSFLPLYAVGTSSSIHEESTRPTTDISQDQQIDLLLRNSNEISKLIRNWNLHQNDDSASVPWTKDDKLRKSINDLIETEADYVRVS